MGQTKSKPHSAPLKDVIPRELPVSSQLRCQQWSATDDALSANCGCPLLALPRPLLVSLLSLLDARSLSSFLRSCRYAYSVVTCDKALHCRSLPLRQHLCVWYAAEGMQLVPPLPRDEIKTKGAVPRSRQLQLSTTSIHLLELVEGSPAAHDGGSGDFWLLRSPFFTSMEPHEMKLMLPELYEEGYDWIIDSNQRETLLDGVTVTVHSWAGHDSRWWHSAQLFRERVVVSSHNTGMVTLAGWFHSPAESLRRHVCDWRQRIDDCHESSTLLVVVVLDSAHHKRTHSHHHHHQCFEADEKRQRPQCTHDTVRLLHSICSRLSNTALVSVNSETCSEEYYDWLMRVAIARSISKNRG